MSQNPTTIQLRYLQTLLELGSGTSTTIVFPLPIDLISPLADILGHVKAGGEPPQPPKPPPPRTQPGLAPTDEPAGPPVTPGLGPADPLDEGA